MVAISPSILRQVVLVCLVCRVIRVHVGNHSLNLVIDVAIDFSGVHQGLQIVLDFLGNFLLLCIGTENDGSVLRTLVIALMRMTIMRMYGIW